MMNNTMKKLGYTHSFVKSLKAVSECFVDIPIETIASLSGFSFRTIVHKDLCLSAMSVFDWSLLKQSAEDIGFEVALVTRLWNEEHLEVERREKAYSVIEKSKYPLIAWDLSIPEWELITGFDSKNSTYKGISVSGEDITFERSELGRREIPILFVMALKGYKKPDGALMKLMDLIVNHHEEKEAIALPDYREGFRAYDYWIDYMKTLDKDDFESRYYFETYTVMKSYAASYFSQLDNPEFDDFCGLLKHLSVLYGNMLKHRKDESFPNNKDIIIEYLKEAKTIEEKIYLEAKDLQASSV
ncbi:hypothetical protein EZV73_04200 [Acidaminobacter sp. JC074]|uniref:hypothetical protein n=1 Tax=Acidaminobacter sp. JC074 TaxID=2530199 RepID=UPI001F10EB9D|nr:hypothetical protein [Acidaminobacter sp. JC074]MCH4886754.1 hypothetical protein [Acidaminobacter sp. JC074]